MRSNSWRLAGAVALAALGPCTTSAQPNFAAALAVQANQAAHTSTTSQGAGPMQAQQAAEQSGKSVVPPGPVAEPLYGAPNDLPADAAKVLPEAAPAIVAVPRMRFIRGTYKEGIEQLRIVQREHTSANIALQVGVNIGLALLTRSTGTFGVAGQGFSKGDLAGAPVEGLQDAALRENPAVSELPRALGVRAAQIYSGQIAAAERAEPAPDELPVVLLPGAWHLVYESLGSDDGLYRLTFGAQVNWPPRLFRVPSRPLACNFASDPATLDQKRLGDWRRLREERAKAVAACTATLGDGLADWL